jgi:NADH-quinone oxidoreductase E subunit
MSHSSRGNIGEIPYVPVFVGALKEELEALLGRYPTKMAALLPTLWMVQRERGWVSEEAMVEVGDQLELTPAYVKGVVTFYTMYHQHPVGRTFIQVCTTAPCLACGADKVVESLLTQTGCVDLGATSPDGRFTVIEVECLGACGFATPIMVNDDFIESVTPEKVPQILTQFT